MPLLFPLCLRKLSPGWMVGVLIAAFAFMAPARGAAANSKASHAPYVSVFTKPPKPLPLYEQLDAPLMGNGDMAAALAGNPEDQQFWLGKNDLWELRPVWRMSGPRPFGHLDIQIPLLKGASYHVEQHLDNATTVSTFKTGKTEITMRSWVSATDNLLVVEMTAKGAPVNGSVNLWIPANARTTPQADHRPKHGTANDWVGAPAAPLMNDGAGTYWGIRAFRDNVAIPAEVACAFHLLGGNGASFTLRPGHPVVLAAAMRSLRQSKQHDYRGKSVDLPEWLLLNFSRGRPRRVRS